MDIQARYLAWTSKMAWWSNGSHPYFVLIVIYACPFFACALKQMQCYIYIIRVCSLCIASLFEARITVTLLPHSPETQTFVFLKMSFEKRWKKALCWRGRYISKRLDTLGWFSWWGSHEHCSISRLISGLSNRTFAVERYGRCVALERLLGHQSFGKRLQLLQRTAEYVT